MLSDYCCDWILMGECLSHEGGRIYWRDYRRLKDKMLGNAGEDGGVSEPRLRVALACSVLVFAESERLSIARVSV